MKASLDKFDNHWLDCLVSCAVAASMQGVSLVAVENPMLKVKPESISLAEKATASAGETATLWCERNGGSGENGTEWTRMRVTKGGFSIPFLKIEKWPPLAYRRGVQDPC